MPILVEGATPEEPAATRVVAAGSVVSCGSLLSGADACGVAFRVAIRVAGRHRLRGRNRNGFRAGTVAAHHVIEVVLARHEVVLGGHLRRVSEPLGDDVGWIPLHPVGLATVVNHAPDRLLTNILDPNADIQPGYQSSTCVLGTGEVVTGIVSAESGGSLTMKLADGSTRTISRNEIEDLVTTNRSFMPEGLETTVTVDQMRDLLAFLRTK